MRSVLFVCIGNICRSPMAEVLFAAAAPHLTVASAGTGALVGEAADPMARSLVAERGLDLSNHRARQLSSEMCQQADIILTMDEGQRRYVGERYPLVRGKVFRLCEVDRIDVPDPFRRGPLAFQHAFTLIDAGVQAWAERIQKFK